jgi:hypothetical protein
MWPWQHWAGQEVGFGTMYFRLLTASQWHFSLGLLAMGLAFLAFNGTASRLAFLKLVRSRNETL